MSYGQKSHCRNSAPDIMKFAVGVPDAMYCIYRPGTLCGEDVADVEGVDFHFNAHLNGCVTHTGDLCLWFHSSMA